MSRARPMSRALGLLVLALGGCVPEEALCLELAGALRRCDLQPVQLECGGADYGAKEALLERLDDDGCAALRGSDGRVDEDACALFGWRCPEPPAPVTGGAPAGPVLFVSGIDGTAAFDWRAELLDAVRSRSGAEVVHVGLPPWEGVAERSAALGRAVATHARTSPTGRVHLVCYAVGGLDCRYLVSPGGLLANDGAARRVMAESVASISTIATPHRGTYVATAALLALDGTGSGDALGGVLGIPAAEDLPFLDLGSVGELRGVRAQLHRLQPSEAERFGEAVGDAPEVHYQSWAGVSHVAGQPYVPGPEAVARDCSGAEGPGAYALGTPRDSMSEALWSVAPPRQPSPRRLGRDAPRGRRRDDPGAQRPLGSLPRLRRGRPLRPHRPARRPRPRPGDRVRRRRLPHPARARAGGARTMTRALVLLLLGGCALPSLDGQQECERLLVELRECAAVELLPQDCAAISVDDVRAISASVEAFGCGVLQDAVPVDADLRSASCRLYGEGCIASTIPAPVRTPATYPVVLVNGTDTSPLFRWSDRIQRVLQDEGGHRVHLATLPPLTSVRVRSEALWRRVEAIRSETGAERVNLVCHSFGGLDCRYLVSPGGLHLELPEVSHRELAGAVASVTTVGTAHRGTPVADATLGLLPEDSPEDAARALAIYIGEWFTPHRIEQDPELRRALTDLSESHAPTFNAAVTDAEGIYYQSWAGFARRYGEAPAEWEARVREACQPDEPFPAVPAWDGVDDHLATPLYPSAEMIGEDARVDPVHDGLCPVASARWGVFRGCIAADHMEQLGQHRIPDVNVRTGIDIARFYAAVAQELAERGY